MESKQIYFIDCTCPDFSGLTEEKRINRICSKKYLCEDCKESKNEEGCGKQFVQVIKPKWIGSRRIKEHGDFCDRKFYAEPCKHLKPIIEMYERDYGFTLKKPKPMEGTDKPTAALKRALEERSGGLCETGCGQKAVHIHRKVRGSNGGKYSEENCVYLCPDCHRRIHSSEFSGSRSK